MEERSDDNKEATQHARQGFRALMWTLLSLIAVIVMVLAMWGRHAHNATSTVNPTKTPPAEHQ